MKTKSTLLRSIPVPAALATLVFAAPVAAQTMHARLSGYQEVPVVSSLGSGEFKAKIDQRAGTIHYELRYSGLQGNILQSHIHFGQHGVNGGISVWLCGTAAQPGPAGTPACVPGNEGVVEGWLTADAVVGPAGQLLAAGEFDELVAAIQAGVTYVNVHSTVAPGGEIRGQLGGQGGASGRGAD